ncbi:MAG: HAD family phosphatase [Spirochaetia bacterium]|nr:HAD family phosphatase [Spirochaetia bacterium]
MKKFKLSAAILDMDGTLLDSMEMWNQVGVRFLEKIGVDTSGGLMTRLCALSVVRMAKILREELGVSISAKEIEDSLNNLMLDFYQNQVELKPGAKEFLDCVKQHDIPCCMVTATDMPLIEAGLKRTGLENYFDFILTGRDAVSDKNSSGIFFQAQEKLGRSVDSTWVFEDALYAIRTAKGAGFHVAALYDKTSDTPGCQDQIRSLADIYDRDISNFIKYFF